MTFRSILFEPAGPVAALAGITAAVTAYWHALHPR